MGDLLVQVEITGARLRSFDFHDTIVPSRLEDLRVESRWAESATDDLLVEIESVGDDPGKTLEIHPVGNVAQEGESIPVASSPADGRRPEPRPDFDRDEDPSRLLLAAGERANLIGLKFVDGESDDRPAVEPTTSVGGQPEPASDSVSGNPFEPSNRGNADTLDSERRDRIEGTASMAKTVVGGALGRRERLSAPDAPVSATFPRPRSVESMAHDAPGIDSPTSTFGVQTTEVLHFAWFPSTKELRLSNSGANSTTHTG